MNQLDLDRVDQARRRLETAASAPHRDDPAIRILELTPPTVDDPDLELHRNFSVIAGLSEDARWSIAETIDALRLNDPTRGLLGIIEDRGRRKPLHAADRSDDAPGMALVPSQPFAASPRTSEAAQLAEVIEMIDRAVLLSNAELRGADAVAAELRERLPQVSTDLALPELDEARRTIAALDEVRPPAEIVDHIARVLEVVEANPDRLALEARRSQAEAARGQVLPGDSRNVAMLADLAVAEADGAIAEFDMQPNSDAVLLASSLELLNIDVDAASAPRVAQQVLDECAELDEIRQRAMAVLDPAPTAPVGDEFDATRAELERVDRHRHHIQRRLRSQQQLLAVAREQWSIHGVGELDLRARIDLTSDSNRPMPILVEEPLDDLPARLGGAILSTLLRHSIDAQVICLSDQRDLESWCRSVGDRVGWVRATGWFAEVTR